MLQLHINTEDKRRDQTRFRSWCGSSAAESISHWCDRQQWACD